MKRMSPSDPSAPSLTRDFRRAEKFVRSARTLLLPKGWSDWRDGFPPREHELQVDQKLAQLADGRRRILSPSEVRAHHPKMYWPSHEVAIRLQLAWYGEVEFQDSITHAAVARQRLNQLRQPLNRRLDLLRHSEKSLTAYLRLTATATEIQSALERVQKEKARVCADLLAFPAGEDGRPAQGWKHWFVFRLAAFWHIITGAQPPSSPDSDFAELVAAAWNSLHPDIEIEWESSVRRFARSASLDEALETAFIASLFAHRSDAELQDVKTYLLAN